MTPELHAPGAVDDDLGPIRRELAAKRVLVTMERPVVDVYLHVPTIPQVGDKVVTGAVRSLAGGVNGNYASSLAGLGATVLGVGSDSDDPLAEIDRESLATAGVQVDWDRDSVGGSTVCYVLVDADGGRSIVISYPEDPERVLDGVLAGTRRLDGRPLDLCYLGVLRDLHAPIVSLVRGTPVAATFEDSDWPSPALLEAVGPLDVVFCADETFAAREAALLSLHEAWGCHLVVTEGSAGSTLIDPSGATVRQGPARIDGPVLDTTGAGDAFASAFSAAHLLGVRGAGLLRIANWYAGQKIQRTGPRSFAPAEEFFTRVAAERRRDDQTAGEIR